MSERAKIDKIGVSGESLSALDKQRIAELQSMDYKQFANLVKDTLPPSERKGTPDELIKRILGVETAFQNATRSEISTEKEHIEPNINDRLETTLATTEAQMRVVRDDEQEVEAPEESLADKLARENKITRFAQRLETGEEITAPAGKAFFEQEKDKILFQVEKIKEGRIINQRLEETRRRASADKPFPAPKSRATEATVSTPVHPEVVIETPRPSLEEVLAERGTRPMPKGVHELLRERSALKKNPAEDLAKQLEHAQDLPKHVLEGQEGKQAQKIFGEKMGVTPTPEAILKKDTVKVPSQEARNGNIDGLVEFNLGKLGINKTELVRNIPNFFTLSVTQQNYVLEKLSRKVNRDLNLESDYELKQKDRQGLVQPTGGKLNAIITGIRNFPKNFARGISKNSRRALIRSSMKENLQKGGLDSYKDSLKTLTNFVETRKIDVAENEKGQKYLQFLKREPLNEEHRKLLEKFNQTASVLAEMPGVWSAMDARKSKQEQVRKAQETYDSVQKQLLAYELKKQSPETKDANVIDIQAINRNIEMNRLLTHNPKVESFAGAVIRDYRLNEKSSFFVMGAGVRSFAQYAVALGGGVTALSAMAGGILGSSVVGGITGGLMKKKELKLMLEQKRASLGNKEKIRGVTETIDGRGYSDRINGLIKKLDTATGEKRKELLQSLKNRVEVSNERLGMQAVAWGRGDREYLDKFDLRESIDRANEVLLRESDEGKKILDKVAKTVYDKMQRQYYKDDAKVGERKEEIKKAIKNGAIFGALGAFAAMETQDWGFNGGEMNKAALMQIEKLNNEIGYAVTGSPEYAPLGTPAQEITRINPTPATAGQPVNFPGQMPRPDSLPYDASEMATPVGASAIVEAPVGARGFIGAIKDLQRGLWDQYGGNMPPNLREFAEGDANKIAIAMGGYRPGEEAESISLPRGSSIVATSEGIKLKVPEGYTEPRFFDSGAGRASTAPIESTPRVAGEGMNAPENQALATESPTTVTGEPEAKFDFEKHKAENLAEGWRHKAVEGGDIFSGEMTPEAAREYQPEFYPDHEPAAPESVEGYQNIDGLEVNTKELKGTVDFIYDNNGDIESVDLPKLQVEDVSRFRARPDAFIGGEHSPAERVALGKKLSTMGSQVETFLKYRRIMEIESLHPDTDEYQFLNDESQKLWSAIQKKVEYQFNPEYKDFKLNPIVNTAPSVTVPPEQGFIPTGNTPPAPAEPAPYVRNLGEGAIATPEDLEKEKALEQAHRVETENPSTREFIKTGRDMIKPDSKIYLDAVSKYGKAKIEGSTIIFDKGSLGFYAESRDLNTAIMKAQSSSRLNSSSIGRMQEQIITQIKDGTYRVLCVYKKL